jgi:hypothetical protein
MAKQYALDMTKGNETNILVRVLQGKWVTKAVVENENN